PTSLKVRLPDTLPPQVEPEALVEWRMMLACGPSPDSETQSRHGRDLSEQEDEHPECDAVHQMAAEADQRGRHPHGVATNPSSGHPRMDREGQGPENDAKGRPCGRGRERDRRGRQPQREDEPGENTTREMKTQSCVHKFLA